jgi:hypothetical protein
MKLDVSESIARPPADEFRFVATDHVQNHPRWDPQMSLVQETPGPIGVRTRIRRRRAAGESRVEGEMEITEYEPRPRHGGGDPGRRYGDPLVDDRGARGEGSRLTFTVESDDAPWTGSRSRSGAAFAGSRRWSTARRRRQPSKETREPLRRGAPATRLAPTSMAQPISATSVLLAVCRSACDESGATTVGREAERPADEDEQPILETDHVPDVDDEPSRPRGKATEREPA